MSSLRPDDVQEIASIWCLRQDAMAPSMSDIASCAMEAAWTRDHMAKAEVKADENLRARSKAKDPMKPRKPRAKHGGFSPSKAELQQMVDDGYTRKQIATHYNVSAGLVQKRMKDLGLTNPRGPRATVMVPADAAEDDTDELQDGMPNGEEDMEPEEIEEENAA